MRLLILLSLALLCGNTQAAVYKWKLPDGSVEFSDQPHPGAEEIVIPKAQTFTPPPRSTNIESQITQKKETTVSYSSVMITTPDNDATIRENSGKIEINVATEPPLQSKEGHKILVKIDGKAIADPSTAQHYVLDNIDRGTHSLQASILDATGNTLMESSTVTFHLKRISILLKNNKNPAQPVNPVPPVNPISP